MEIIPTRFCWLSCSKSEHQYFYSLDILISAELSLILRKCKVHWEKWRGRRVRFNEQSMYKRWRALLHTAIAENNQEKNKHTLCVHTKWKWTKRWRVFIYRLITKQVKMNREKKQAYSLCFVNVFKVQDRLKKFLRNKNDIN